MNELDALMGLLANPNLVAQGNRMRAVRATQPQQQPFEMSPTAERLAILPHPVGALRSEGRLPGSVMSAPIQWNNWVAPSMVKSAVDAFNAPYEATQGKNLGAGDAMNVALNTVGAGLGATFANPVGAGSLGMNVWHGTPHTLPPTPRNPLGEFDLAKVGTGEGAQAYGHGIYLAESPGVALNYAKSNVYKVDLPDQHVSKMLDWDKPLSEQSQHVVDAINRFDPKRTLTGQFAVKQNVYGDKKFYLVNKYNGEWGSTPFNTEAEALKASVSGKAEQSLAIKNERAGIMVNRMEKLYGPEKTSQMLREAGIPGIKYLDQGSRSAGEGSRNFVVFDPKIANILERNGMTRNDALDKLKNLLK